MYPSSVAPLAPSAFDVDEAAYLSGASGRPPVFDCSFTDRGRDASWVRLAGELDLFTTPLLEEVLCPSRLGGLRARLVVLDMRDLEFLDTSGVHAITDAGRRARQAGGRLVLVRGSPAVDRIFTLTRTSEQLAIVDLDPGQPAVMALLHLAQADRSG